MVAQPRAVRAYKGLVDHHLVRGVGLGDPALDHSRPSHGRDGLRVEHGRDEDRAYRPVLAGPDEAGAHRGPLGSRHLGEGAQRLDLGGGVVPQALDEVGVVAVGDLGRAEGHGQLRPVGGVQELGEDVLGAPRRGPRGHREPAGQAGHERERQRGPPVAAQQPGDPHPHDPHRRSVGTARPADAAARPGRRGGRR